jgi:hypothetical protein
MFMPTHHTQKKCVDHRDSRGPLERLRKLSPEDHALTPEEREWKEYGKSVASKLAKRPDAQVLPRNG